MNGSALTKFHMSRGSGIKLRCIRPSIWIILCRSSGGFSLFDVSCCVLMCWDRIWAWMLLQRSLSAWNPERNAWTSFTVEKCPKGLSSQNGN